MKKLFLLFLALPMMGFAGNFNLDVTSSSELVYIGFKTQKTFSSMCHLGVHELNIEPAEEEKTGRIEFKAYRDPMAACLTAFGPHSGSLRLNREEHSLTSGDYDLFINGSSEGAITVRDDATEL